MDSIHSEGGSFMVRRNLALLALLVLTGCNRPPVVDTVAPLPAQQEPSTTTAKVIGVTDGDTLTVLVDKEQVKIRLHGIDAPESGQPYGAQAKRELSKLCFGQIVQVRKVDVDRYGRTVAVIEANDRNMNESLLRRGAAWHYTEYDQSPEFAAAEREAKNAGAGLWADVRAVPPWEWRGLTPAGRTAVLTNREAPRDVSSLVVSPVPEPTKGNTFSDPPAHAMTHWLNTKTGVRHRSSCRWYGQTKNGRPCTADEGEACKVCGG